MENTVQKWYRYATSTMAVTEWRNDATWRDAPGITVTGACTLCNTQFYGARLRTFNCPESLATPACYLFQLEFSTRRVLMYGCWAGFAPDVWWSGSARGALEVPPGCWPPASTDDSAPSVLRAHIYRRVCQSSGSQGQGWGHEVSETNSGLKSNRIAFTHVCVSTYQWNQEQSKIKNLAQTLVW